ncbi:STAS domain-containing protein [Streptomyces glaucus]|uniref:Anti-sigma factor antagonist n=1 Tax=Streptomyces glaucus TaxID=284029 RepID=A0ABP5WYP9_9ACTN
MTEKERTLDIAQRPDPAGPIVLRLDGELDYHTVPRLKQALDDIPFAQGSGVIFDLSGLEYCDSSGLTALIAAHHRADAAGSTVSIAGLRPHLARVFGITGLDQFFTLHSSTEQALEHLRR